MPRSDIAMRVRSSRPAQRVSVANTPRGCVANDALLPPDHSLVGNRNVRDAAAVARLLMNTFSSGLPEVQRSHMRNAALASDPVVMSTIASGALDEAHRKVAAADKLPKVVLRYDLTIEEQERLVRSFPEFNLQFSDKPKMHPHAYAAAHRTVALHELVRRSHVDPKRPPRGAYNHTLKFVGGNPAHHIYGHYRYCHTCMPILDAVDSNRNAKFIESLKAGNFDRVSGMKPVVDSLFAGKDTYFCHNRSQYCNYTAPVLISLHSIYDCDATAIVGMMESAQADVMYGVMMFDPAILVRDEGEVRYHKAHYRRYLDKGTDYIEFGFRGDVQMHYRHKLSNYLLVPTHSVLSSSKSSFYVEREYSDGALFFAIRRLRSGVVPRSELVFSYPEVEDYYVLYAPYKTAGGVGQMTRRRLIVPRKLWDLAYTYALSLDEQKFRFKRVLCALTSFNTRAVNKGESFEQQQLTDPMDLMLIAQSVFLLVYVENYTATQTEKEMRARLDDIRDANFSLWMRIKNVLSGSAWRRRLGMSHNHDTAVEESFDVSPASCTAAHPFIESLQESATMRVLPRLVELPVLYMIQEEIAARYCDLPSEIKQIYKEVVEPDLCMGDEPAVMRETTCSASLRVVPVPGDGDCLLHALNSVGAITGLPHDLRIKYAKRARDESQKKRFLAPRGTSESYLELDDIALIAKLENFSVCVHTDSGCIRVHDATQLYHIRFRGTHYDALVEQLVLPPCPTTLLSGAVAPPVDRSRRDVIYSSVSKNVWRRGKIAADPYSGLNKGGYVSRAGLKLAELCYRGLIQPRVPAALDIGGGPGGFAQVLLERGVGTLVGVTKRVTVDNPSDYPYDRTLCSYENFYVARGDGEVDLLQQESTSSVIHEILDRVGKFELIVGDASVGSDEDGRAPTDTGSDNYRLLESECRMVKSLLLPGGQVCLKLAEPDDERTARLVIELSAHFVESKLVKPLTSRAAARELYLVGQGYCADRVREIDLAHYYGAYTEHYENELRAMRMLRHCALTATSAAAVEFNDQSTVAVMRKTITSVSNVIAGGAFGQARYLDQYRRLPDYDSSCDLTSYLTVSTTTDNVPSSSTGSLYTTCSERSVDSAEKNKIATAQKPVRSKFGKMLRAAYKSVRAVRHNRSDVFVKPPSSYTPEDIARLMDYKNVQNYQDPCDEVAVPEDAMNMRSDPRAKEREAPQTGPEPGVMNLSSRLTLAQREYSEYLEYLIEARKQEHLQMYRTCTASTNPESALEAFEKKARYGRPVDLKGSWLYCFDGTNFVRFSRELSKMVLVTEDTAIFTDIDIYQSISSTGASVQEFCCDFIQAGPGCGKTTFLIEEVQNSEMILVSTREGKFDVLNRLRRCRPDCTANVRTIHSFLIRPDKVERLLIDEALMQHAGMIAYAIQFAGCTRVLIVGDILQIPFVNRCPDFRHMEHAHLTDLLQPTKVLNVSYRVPADVAARFTRDYEPHGLKTTNLLRDTCACIPITSISNVPILQKVQYLTFLQYEKEMVRSLGVDVSTVNEYQGKQSDHIIVVRLVPSTHVVKIFSERAYVLVALTRHTRRLEYYTVHPGDLMARVILDRPSIPDCDRCSIVTGGALNIYAPRESVPVRSVALTSMSPEDYVVYRPMPVRTVVNAARAGRHIRFCAGFDLAPYLNALEQYNRAKVSWIPNSISTTTDRYLALNTVDEFTGYAIPAEDVEKPAIENELNAVSFDLGSLQNFINLLFPSSAFVRNDEDTWMVENSPLRFNMPGVRLKPQKGMLMDVSFGTMQPKLTTPMPHRRPETTTEVLLALLKRNCAVPKLVLALPLITVMYRMVDRFFAVYFEGDLKADFEQYSVGTFKEWLDAQPPIVGESLEDYDVRNRIRNDYAFIIKPTPKPRLDDVAGYEYSALQTVMYQDKAVNAYFCPIFRALKKTIMRHLLRKFRIFTDCSPSEFAQQVTESFRPSQLDTGLSVEEMDIGKYDKSQGVLALMIECEIMRRVGVPDTVVEMWYHQHVYSRYHCYSVGVSGVVHFQRRSGDAATFLGNTMFLMAVIADSMRVEDCSLALFSGDDSLLIGKNVRNAIDENRLAAVYNLQAKRLHYRSLYFCSKFLLPDLVVDEWKFCFDPVKLLVKLGRNDLRNREHVEEYRISVLDTVSAVTCERDISLLAEALRDRYSLDFDPTHYLHQLCSLPRDSEAFHSLYEEPGDLRLLNDPSTPGLDF